MSKEKLNLDLVENMMFDGFSNPRYGVVHSDELDDVFCDYAEYDGYEMTDKDLDILNDDYHDFVWESAFEKLCT